jgi:5'-nucleotidase
VLKPWLDEVLGDLLHQPSPPLLNVNFPEKPVGVRWTHLSVRHYDGKIIPATDPMGREHFWFTVAPVEEVEENSDRWAIQHGFISITPLTLDLTDRAALAQHRPPAPD